MKIVHQKRLNEYSFPKFASSIQDVHAPRQTEIHQYHFNTKQTKQISQKFCHFLPPPPNF